MAKTKLTNPHRVILMNYAFENLDDPKLIAAEEAAVAAAKAAVIKRMKTISNPKFIEKHGKALTEYFPSQGKEVQAFANVMLPIQFRISDPESKNGVAMVGEPHSVTPFAIDITRSPRDWHLHLHRDLDRESARRHCMEFEGHSGRDATIYRDRLHGRYGGMFEMPSAFTTLTIPSGGRVSRHERNRYTDENDSFLGGVLGIEARQTKIKTTDASGRPSTQYADTLESFYIDKATSDALLAMYRAGHARWHHKFYLLTQVANLLRAANYIEDVEAAWPEAKAVRVDLVTGATGLSLPAPVYDLDALSANMAARGITEAPTTEE